MSLQRLQSFTFLKSSRFLFQFMTLPKFLESSIGAQRNDDPTLAFNEYIETIRSKSLGTIRYSELRKDMTYLCESVEFPGQTLTGTDYRIPGRMKIKSPTVREYNEITASFLYPEQIPVYEFFSNWISKISAKNSQNYYFDEITSAARVIQFAEGGTSTFNNPIADNRTTMDTERQPAHTAIRFQNLYPTSVSPMQSNWGDDGFQKISVTFFFESFFITNYSTYGEANVDKLNELTKVDARTIAGTNDIAGPPGFNA